MQNAEAIAYGLASLLMWQCNDPDHLRELIGQWEHADTLSDEDKELVVQLTAHWPAQRLGPPRRAPLPESLRTPGASAYI